jgi:four helix bundle protein
MQNDLKERTMQMALRVGAMVEFLPKSRMAKNAEDQIIRASSSVAANYRAACKRKSTNDFIYKLRVVLEEADETLFWLEYIERGNLLPSHRLKDLQKEVDELVAIFTASLNTAIKNKIKKQA